jgi:hypothetical protein
MTLAALHDLIRRAVDPFALYITLVKGLTSEENREISGRLLQSAGLGRHPSRVSADQRIGLEIVLNGVDFVLLRERFAEIASAWTPSADERELSVALAIELLSRMDHVVAELLLAEKQLTYPSSPSPDKYAIVLKPLSRYDFGGTPYGPEDAAPETLRVQFWTLLRETYAVAPAQATSSRFPWSIRRIPAEVDAILKEQQDRHGILLVSVPHHSEDLATEVDEHRRRYRVTGLQEGAEQRICGEISTLLESRPEDATWSVIVAAEYSATPLVRRTFQERIEQAKTAFILPGSARELNDGRFENCCRSIGPAGTSEDDLPRHAKMIRHPMTESQAPAAMRPVIQRIKPPHLLEDIDVAHCALTIWDSAALGRFAVLTCRDVLDEDLRSLLRSHFIEHLFVPAMSVTLDDFLNKGTELAGFLGAGLYVANAPLVDPQDGSPKPAAVGYRPIRGGHRTALATCPPGLHGVCAHLFSPSKGWLWRGTGTGPIR